MQSIFLSNIWQIEVRYGNKIFYVDFDTRDEEIVDVYGLSLKKSAEFIQDLIRDRHNLDDDCTIGFTKKDMKKLLEYYEDCREIMRFDPHYDFDDDWCASIA